ncbi:hypothetical protein [Legionella quateirensis]|uniref:Conjugative transfer protein n=1 Tax=Legionella quateirensis TaxID=45072 RepID=A0A378KQU2_9GAMM|nr:hypothetical protein [Legionella quateirensis]KTD47793.1 conjugative transfer protein [Legionella quateirensis]STY16686.1 conjugative transfer protein [Legionella quateirensis]
MKLLSLLLTIIFCSLLVGCGTMNSDFSCKVTAGDSCLTIEQVDAMTRFADGSDSQYRPRKTISKIRRSRKLTRPYLSKNDEQPIWVAPWKDKTGKTHQAGKLYAGRLQQNAQG